MIKWFTKLFPRRTYVGVRHFDGEFVLRRAYKVGKDRWACDKIIGQAEMLPGGKFYAPGYMVEWWHHSGPEPFK